MNLTTGGYELDDDPTRVDLDAVWRFLSTEAYWHRWRTRPEIEAQIATSWRVVGAYLDGEQVGFARAVSDGVAIGYLADVYIVEAHRGRGLGTQLVRSVVEHGPGGRFRWMLHTADAAGLYRKVGFGPAPDNYMERPADRS